MVGGGPPPPADGRGPPFPPSAALRSARGPPRARLPRRSDGKVLQRHVNPEPLGDCLEHPLGFGDHFRPDAIAGEDRDAVRFHHVSPFPDLVSRLLSYAPIRSSSSNVLPMTSSPRSNMSRR